MADQSKDTVITTYKTRPSIKEMTANACASLDQAANLLNNVSASLFTTGYAHLWCESQNMERELRKLSADLSKEL